MSEFVFFEQFTLINMNILENPLRKILFSTNKNFIVFICMKLPLHIATEIIKWRQEVAD